MSQLLLSCDQVFDVLTRGPFPTGAPDDAAVERHLCACHDCRQLAAALQPAVALLHEAIGDGETQDLPQYQGLLACQPPVGLRRAAGRLESGAAACSTARRVPQSRARSHSQPSSALGNVRWVALSLLAMVAAIFASGLSFAPGTAPALTGLFGGPPDVPPADGVPGQRSLLTLAALNLPVACLPRAQRPTTAAEAAQIAESLANGSLAATRCCTECHRAGQPTGARAAKFVALSDVTCRACHRG